MTPTDVIYHRRVALLAEVERTGNVAAACRRFGISRTRYYEWRRRCDLYGLEVLHPKEAPPPVPGATPTHVVDELLTLAVTRPTLGCRGGDALEARGLVLSESSLQRLLVAHGLGARRQLRARRDDRRARPASRARSSARRGRVGFCLFSPAPGHLVSVDGFYIGHLKVVGTRADAVPVKNNSVTRSLNDS